MIFRWRIPIKRENEIGLTTSHYSEMKIKFSEEKVQIENIQLWLHCRTNVFYHAFYFSAVTNKKS